MRENLARADQRAHPGRPLVQRTLRHFRVRPALVSIALWCLPSTVPLISQSLVVETPPSLTIAEDTGLVCLTLERGEITQEALELLVFSEKDPDGDTATLGLDWEYLLGTGDPLSWPARTPTLEFCPFRVLDDETLEQTEVFSAWIYVADEDGRSLGVVFVTIFIEDDDLEGVDLSIRAEIGTWDGEALPVDFVVDNLGTEPAWEVELSVSGDVEITCEITIGDEDSFRKGCAYPQETLESGAEWRVLGTVRPEPRRGPTPQGFEGALEARVSERGDDVRSSNDLIYVDLSPAADECPDFDESPICACFLRVLRRELPDRLPTNSTRTSTLSLPSAVASFTSALVALPRRAADMAAMLLDGGKLLFDAYRVRDRLEETPGGRRAIDLYYRHTREVSTLVLDDPVLLADAVELLSEWSELIALFGAGRAEEAVPTSSHLLGLELFVDKLEQRGGASLAADLRLARARIGLTSLAGESLAEARRRLDLLPCAAEEGQLCLGGGRFAVDVSWRDFDLREGLGRAVELTDDTGSFWFFDPDNLELLVKVLDATTFGAGYWVFFGSLSNVAFEMNVTDTETGRVRTYTNELGNFASVGDTSAFSSSSGDHRLHAAPTAAGRRGRFRNEARPVGAATAPESCETSGEVLCLDDRYRVQAQWRDFDGDTGSGRARAITSDSGAFWFFDEANLELMVKALDATAINGHVWIFYGSLSNVGFTLEVTDTVTGQVIRYENPVGEFSSVGDTEAIPRLPED